MLQVIRDALLPFARPESTEETRTRQALVYFSEHPRGTVTDLAALLGCSKRSTERLVANLRSEGKLRREGSARGGTWVVEDTPANVGLFREWGRWRLRIMSDPATLEASQHHSSS